MNYWFGEMIKKRIVREYKKEQKLKLIKYLAYFYTNNISGKYSDEVLEKELAKIGSVINYSYNGELIKPNTVLHVMTKAYDIGGHTAVVNNWIDFDKEKKHSVVFTDSKINEVPQFLKNSVESSGGRIFCLTGSDSLDKARQLLRIAACFERIVLSIHMFDVIPIIAFSNRNWRTPIYFYNHANFSFSLGMSIADMVLCICNYDKGKALLYRGAFRAEVLPVPYMKITSNEITLTRDEAKRTICQTYHIPLHSKIIVSMSSDYKYSLIQGYDYAAFVERLLQETPDNIYFFIIGANPDALRWKELGERTKGRMKALGILLRDDVTVFMKCADLYIDSFPMVSGGWVEAMEENIPVIALRVTNRAMEIRKKFSYDNVDELIKAAKRVLINNDPLLDKKETEQILESRTRDIWLKRLNDIYHYELEHENHKFTSKFICSKEEIINAQLIEHRNDYKFKEKLSILNQLYIGLYKFIFRIKNEN